MMIFMGLAAMNTKASLLFGIFGLMLGVMMVSWLLSRFVLRKLDIRRLLPEHAVVGQATLAVSAAATTRLSIGDLDGDGVMDLLFTGGTFNKDGTGTKLWWMKGKKKD